MEQKPEYSKNVKFNYLRYIYIPIILLGFCYFLFWWTYKLELLPGLHADEAWVGLEAISFNSNGNERLHAMNNYTGVLQIYFSSLSFKWLNVGVFQLRIFGVLLNAISIILMFYFFYLNKLKRALFIFLLITSQSVFFMLSPRIAWEVNSFTFFLIALLLVSVTKLAYAKLSISNIWVGVFFAVNVIGTYNHVIFSCISVSALLGLIFWSMRNKTSEYQYFILIGTINLFNLVILFVLMKRMFYINHGQITVLSILTLMICMESFALNFILKIRLRLDWGLKFYGIFLVVLGSMCLFTFYHGFSFLQVLTNYKVLTHVLSYESSLFEQAIYIVCGALYIYYLFMYLLNDLSSERGAILAYVIVMYLGVINVYTIECSFRYYLSIFYLTAVYLSIELSKDKKRSIPMICVLVFSFFLTNRILLTVFIDDQRVVKPKQFNMGNNKFETSAHFLQTQPLVDFLKENKVLSLRSDSNQYFLEKPVFFYYKIDPWSFSDKKTALIEYDYNSFGSGFIMHVLSNK
nr:hypothetical protein [Pedobacter panaciterrae]